MCCAGTLHVITAHPLIYIKIMSLMLLIAGSIGTKKRPSQIIPWLFTKWSTFSATLNSPYSGYNNHQFHSTVAVHEKLDAYKDCLKIPTPPLRAVSHPETAKEINDENRSDRKQEIHSDQLGYLLQLKQEHGCCENGCRSTIVKVNYNERFSM